MRLPLRRDPRGLWRQLRLLLAMVALSGQLAVASLAADRVAAARDPATATSPPGRLRLAAVGPAQPARQMLAWMLPATSAAAADWLATPPLRLPILAWRTAEPGACWGTCWGACCGVLAALAAEITSSAYPRGPPAPT